MYMGRFFGCILSIARQAMEKFFSFGSVKVKISKSISLTTSFIHASGGAINVDKGLKTRKNVEFRASKRGTISVGKNCFFNNGCMVVAHQKISIGNNCQFGPNVAIFDHDHDYSVKEGIDKGLFKTGDVLIGNNVWIGSNVVILRNSKIGDNCVIGAGAVVKGNIDSDTLFYDERNHIKKIINRGL